MKRRALTRGLTLLLALSLLLAFAFSAMAMTKPIYNEGPKFCKHFRHCPHWPKPNPTPTYSTPVNDKGYMIIRVLTTDDALLKTPFTVSYTVAGVTKKEVLAPAKTSAAAVTYKMTMTVGTKFDVSQLTTGYFDTTVNGTAGMSFSGTIKAGDNVVEFVNTPIVAEAPEVPALG